jgi:hypothetical protein
LSCGHFIDQTLPFPAFAMATPGHSNLSRYAVIPCGESRPLFRQDYRRDRPPNRYPEAAIPLR